jgi:hypothetical protein
LVLRSVPQFYGCFDRPCIYRDKKVVGVFVRFHCAASIKEILGKMIDQQITSNAVNNISNTG